MNSIPGVAESGNTRHRHTHTRTVQTVEWRVHCESGAVSMSDTKLRSKCPHDQLNSDTEKDSVHQVHQCCALSLSHSLCWGICSWRGGEGVCYMETMMRMNIKSVERRGTEGRKEREREVCLKLSREPSTGHSERERLRVQWNNLCSLFWVNVFLSPSLPLSLCFFVTLNYTGEVTMWKSSVIKVQTCECEREERPKCTKDEEEREREENRVQWGAQTVYTRVRIVKVCINAPVKEEVDE